MSGYFAAPPQGWADARAMIGGEWTRDMAILDLRYWQDQVLGGLAERVPSERTLADLWGWGRKKVRLLMSRPQKWSDPRKLAEWLTLYEGTKRGPGGAGRGPTGDQEGPNEGPSDQDCNSGIDEEGPSEGPHGAQGGPSGAQGGAKRGDTRDPYSPPPPPPPPPPPRRKASGEGKGRGSKAKHPAFDRCKSIWNDKVVPHLAKQGHQIPSHPGLDPSSGLGLTVNRWLHERDDLDGSKLRKLFRWFASSDHDRATFLRSKGMGLQTLVRPSHYDEYVGFASLDVASKPKLPAVAGGWRDPRDHPYHARIKELLVTSPDPNDHRRPVTTQDIADAVREWGPPPDADGGDL